MTLRKTMKADNRVKSEDIVINEEAEEVFMGMSMDRASLVNISNLLTDLYTNPIEATVREVISNAIDATVAENSSENILVTSPTVLSPMFVVEDFGTGMSRDTVAKVYSQYGASTKGDDYSQIGAFGLGAKAPLAYCTEYTVETTRDGITTLFTVGRKTEGNFVKILFSEETGRSNGTKITVPARGEDASKFQEAVEKYRDYSFDTAITVDGEVLESNSSYLELGELVLDETSETSGRVWVHKEDLRKLLNSSWGLLEPGNYRYKSDPRFELNHVLSGWPYENPSSEPYTFYSRHLNIRIVSELKPGVVDYTTSRDAITSNERSVALYEKVLGFLRDNRQSHYDKIIADYKNQEDSKELISFAGFLLSSPGIDFPVEKLDEGITVNSVTLSLDDFTHKSGINPILDMHNAFKSFDKDAFGVMKLRANNHGVRDVYAAFDKFDGSALYGRLDTSSYVSSVTEKNSLLRNAVSEKKQNVSISEVALSRVVDDSNDTEKNLVITGVTEDNISRVLRARLTLARNGYQNYLVFLSSKDKGEFDFDFEELFTVEEMSADELFELVRTSAPKRKVQEKKARSTTRTFGKLTTTLSEFLDTGRDKLGSRSLRYSSLEDSFTNVSASIDEILDTGAHLYIGSLSWEAVLETLYGALNQGVDVKELYVLRAGGRITDLLESDYAQLKDYENLLASKEFSYHSKSAKEIMENKVFHSHYLESDVMAVPLEILQRSYFHMNSHNQGNLRVLATATGLHEDIASMFSNDTIPVAYTKVLRNFDIITEMMEKRDKKLVKRINEISEYVSLINYRYYHNNNGATSGPAENIVRAAIQESGSLDHDLYAPAVKVVVENLNDIWNS